MPYPDAQRLLERLHELPIEAELREGGRVWVSAIDQRDSRQIWEAASETGVLIQQLIPARNSLEEIFFNTVREAESASS